MSILIEVAKSYEFWLIFSILLPILYLIYTKLIDPCKIPGPFNIPIIGYVPIMLSKTPHKKMTELAEKYGDVIQVWTGSTRTVILNSSGAIKEAYNKMEFAGRPDVTGFRMWNENVEESIVFMSETKQQQMFRRASLIATQKMIQIDSQKVIDLFNKAVDYILTELEDKKRPLQEIVKMSIASIIGTISFGKVYHPRSEGLKKVYEMNEKLNELFPLNAIYDAFPYLKIFYTNQLKILKNVMIPYKSFLQNELDQHQVLEEGQTPSSFQDLFEEMYKSREKYGLLSSLNRLRWVGSDLFAAGFGTTGDHLIRALVVLARYPEIQEKIYSEVSWVLRRAEANEVVSWESKQDMPYTQAFLEELFREFAHVPLGVPRATQADVEFRGYFIPKGTTVLQNTWKVHHDKTIYGEDVDVFRPERFLNSDGSFLDRPHPKLDNIMAFGYGRRKCVGEILARKELFCMISTIVRKASLRLAGWEGETPLETVGTFLLGNKDVSFNVDYR